MPSRATSSVIVGPGFAPTRWKTAPGTFTPRPGPGSRVHQDAILGRIRTLEGDVIEEIRCPVDGVIRTLFPKRVVHAGSIVYRGWVDGGDDGGDGSPNGGRR